MYFCSSGVFQSTLPHGERRSSRRIFPARKYFNPRSRMGSDDRDIPAKTAPVHFNPRSRMGSDSGGSCFKFPWVIFQSTLPHGERRHTSRSGRMVWDYFNPRSRMGSDASRESGALHKSYFNPRSRMGSDGPILSVMS